MKALIQNNKVVDVAETEFETVADMTWVGAKADTQVGDTWDGTNFSPADTRTNEQKAADDLAKLRSNRDKILKTTDHWALSDTGTMTQAQTNYRKALRDITDTYSSENDEGFAWPTKP